MAIDKEEVANRMAHFEEVCQSAGIKLTHQRMEIFREVAQTEGHPDAEAVHRAIRKRLPRVSLDTVYRTLWLLKDLGLIATLGSAYHRTRFDANLKRHHHFVCRQCGMTRDFYSDTFDSLVAPESLKAVGRVEVTYVEVRGICHECQARDKAKQKQIE